MKKHILFGIFILSFFAISCKKNIVNNPDNYNCSWNFNDSSLTNPEQIKFQSLLNSITSKGVAGISMTVYKPSYGLWCGASGMADLFSQTVLKPCNITRAGSVVKTFTAVTILKLRDEGKLNLDDKISAYLDQSILEKIENTNEATIRQLLNHSSGIYNYIQNLRFQTASLNDLIREWHAEDLLKYAHNQTAYFKPGEDVRYSNTNYILLGLIIESIENKPFYEVFKEKIFNPLNLSATCFAAENPVPQNIIRGYIDLYSNLQLTEATYYSGWDYYTADGGLITNTYELTVFFKSLIEGQLISQQSLLEMLEFRSPNTPDPAFFPISYGLGIFKMETPYGNAYFHSGDAIGYYANMIYFPDAGIYITYAVNSNYGLIDQHVSTREAMLGFFKEIL